MKPVVFIALVLVLAGCSRHAPDPHDVYRDVPDSDRESLRAAVRQFVELQKTADWEKMYEVAAEPKDEKDRFIRRRSAARALRNFTPTTVTWVPDGWVVSGCGVYEPGPNQPAALISSLHATPNAAKPGKWLLTPVAVDIVPDAPGNIQPCSPPPAGAAK